MRDYPIVPNVFRVASSHSVDTDCASSPSSGGCDIKITSGTNANLYTGQLRQQQQIQQKQQQQQQHHQQKQNGNISGQQQQSLVKSSISSQTPQTTITKTILGQNTTTTTTTTTVATTSPSSAAATLKTSTSQQQQQQQLEQHNVIKKQPNKNEVDFIMHNHISLQNQQQQSQQHHHHHKLTTHASIERPQYLRTSQLYLQSPYATLPRNTPTNHSSTLSLLSANNDDDVAAHDKPKQHHHNSLKNKINNHHSNNNNNNKNLENNQSRTNDHILPPTTMLGVINTISGSIPATGYNMNNQQHHNVASSKSHSTSATNRSMSMGSDLNVSSMNNSYTNLSKLNGVQQHHQQQQQQRSSQQLGLRPGIDAGTTIPPKDCKTSDTGVQHWTLQQQQQQQQKQQQKQTTLQQRDFKQTTTLEDFAPYRRQYPCSSIERNTNGYLWIITPVAASISVAIVIAALAGPQWLFTEEKLPNTMYNGTANFNVLDDGAFITRYTKSSLWIICSTVQGVETYSCIKIDYFSEKGYQPDPHDSASAIPYTVTKSCPFFLASGIVLLLSFIVFLIPTCSHQNNLFYFSAGIMFIVSGLLMLIGLIAYISILKAEIGSKLRPRSTLQPPMFKVTYGQSFFLFVFGFIATEFVGLLNIFLYISLQEVGYYSRLPCFTISNLHEKIKEGENRFNSHTYKSYKHEIERKPIDRIRNQQNKNKKHQVTAQELELDTKKLLKNVTKGENKTTAGGGRGGAGAEGDTNTDATKLPYSSCRKHPNAMSSTMILNELDRRYYFEKQTSSSTQNKCNLHTKNLAKSLNELYTETSSSMLPAPPPPSAIRAGRGGVRGLQLQTQTLPRPPQQFSDSPQEFPLTRSVSTTTDIYATQNVSISGGGGGGATTTKTDYSNNRKRNVATNTRYNTDTETQTNVGGKGGSGSNNTKSHIQQQQQQQQQHRNSNHINLHSKKLNQQQQHGNVYKKNYPTTCASNINGDDGLSDDNDHHIEDNVDDDDDEEEPTQKLCGLKRTIRKTKDELFEEFCKRAGVRPKPKNIYYIENDDDVDNATTAVNSTIQQSNEIEEEEMQHKALRLNNTRTSSNLHQRRLETPGNHQQQQQHHGNMGEYCGNPNSMETNRIFGDAIDDVDVDEDVDENDFKKMTENEDHLYVIDDNVHLMPKNLRNGRRASMYVEPNHLRRLNSNLSLHAIYAPVATRGLQKSLYDLDTTNNDFGFITAQQHHQQQPQYALRDTYGGSQQRLHNDYHNQTMYQSRTLPRTFLKRSADSQDSIVSAGINASATQLHNIYSASQQRLTTLMMQQQQQQQQQLQQQNRYLSLSREQELYNSRYALHKSNEELNRHYIQQQQQQPIYIQPTHHIQYQHQQQQHPATSLSSTNYTGTNILKQPSLVQWPAAIPSSPSNFSGSSLRMYGPAAVSNTQNSNHTLVTRSQSGSTAVAGVGAAATAGLVQGSILSAGGQQVLANGSANGTQGPAKFQRAFAFDEQRRASNVVGDAFDLDEIERERRRSHASLFTGLTVNASVNTNVGVHSAGGGGGGVGVIGNTNKNHEQYDMINGTAV